MIVRTLKNGKKQTFNGNKYIIVLKKPVKRRPKTITRIITKRIFLKKPERLNSVIVHMGVDLWGNEAYGGLGGLSYSRRVMSDVRIIGTGLTNGVFMGGIGFDF